MENEPSLNFLEEAMNRMRAAEDEKKKAFRKNLPSYICTGIVSIIEIGVVIAIFDALYGSEQIFMGGIVILYTYIRSIGAGLMLTHQVHALALSNEMYQIKKKLEIPQGEDTEEKIIEGNRRYNKLETQQLVRSFGLLVTFVIALLSIFNNL